MKDIRRVARRTVEALEEGGYKCCLFGSAACVLWGMDGDGDRTPNDIDVVVFTDDDPEDIKEYLTDANDRFFLKDGKEGDYKVLWYSICWRPQLHVKVDILTHGREPLGIPNVPKRTITKFSDDIPLMPFLPLLILKVQGWRDHRASSKARFRRKISQDEADIKELLLMLDDDDNLKRFKWLPAWFRNNASEVVEAYTKRFPRSKGAWRSIGFDV